MYTDRLAALRAAEHGLAFGRLDDRARASRERRYIGRLGLLDERPRVRAAADGLARAGRPAVLHGHRGLARGHPPAPAPAHPAPRGRSRSTTRCWTSTPPTPAGTSLGPDQRGRAAGRGRRAPHRPDGRHRRHHPVRAGRDHPLEALRACWSCRAGRAPARPPSRCTAPPTCSTPTATGWPAAACWSSGPNPTFLRYIGQVLPSLGETGVVLGTVGAAVPGARRAAPRARARPRRSRAAPTMAAVIAAAVRDRQQVPAPRPIELVVEQQRVRLDRDVADPARTRARRSRKPHNEARGSSARRPMRLLAEQVARAARRLQASTPRGLLDAGDLADIREELRREPRSCSARSTTLWPTLSAAAAAHRPVRGRAAARTRWRAASRPTSARACSAPRSPTTCRPASAGRRPTSPLLDEAAELLGDDGAEAAAPRRPAALREEVSYAQGVLDVLDLEEDLDDELLRAGDIVDAERLAERQAVAPLRLDGRARRRRPRVDLRPRDRRRGAGAVGDGVAAGDAALPEPVDDARRRHRADRRPGRRRRRGARCSSPYVANRWRLEQLTVNYRTPGRRSPTSPTTCSP